MRTKNTPRNQALERMTPFPSAPCGNPPPKQNASDRTTMKPPTQRHAGLFFSLRSSSKAIHDIS